MHLPLTRELTLDAGSELFYGDGVRAVNLDVVAARAGATTSAHECHFRSKDDLIGACFAARDQPSLATF